MEFDHACCPFQSGQSITIADLDELEQATNTVFPPDYKAFLLKANGGSLRPFAFELEVPGADFKEKVHSLEYLYEIKEIHRRSQLKMEPALRNIPPGRLAIGSTVSEPGPVGSRPGGGLGTRHLQSVWGGHQPDHRATGSLFHRLPGSAPGSARSL